MRTEEDIRAAYESLARQAPDTAAVLAAVRANAGPPGRKHGRWRLLAPLTAAAAVIAVVGSLIAVGSIGGPAASRRIPPNAPAPDGAPRYYLVLTQRREGQPLSTFHVRALLRDTASGAVLANVDLPAGFSSIAAVAGAANDRTFVLAVQRTTAPGGQPPASFWRAQFDPARRAVTLTRLPIPVMRGNEPIDGMALSPDGTRLAVATRVPKTNQEQISVYSMTTYAVRTWRGNIGSSAVGMSFDQAGQLAYDCESCSPDGVWLLDTTTAGGSLKADSRLAVGMPNDVDFLDRAVLLTRDGRTVVGAEIRATHTGLRAEIAEYSAATGRLTRTLLPARNAPEQVEWTNTSGTVLIVAAPRKNGLELGVLRGRQFTRIPNPNQFPALINPVEIAF